MDGGVSIEDCWVRREESAANLISLYVPSANLPANADSFSPHQEIFITLSAHSFIAGL